MKVRFHPLAEKELVSAALYLQNKAQLGDPFLDEFERWTAQIKANPESCPEIGLGIRKGIINRFHYLVAYKIKGEGKTVTFGSCTSDIRPRAVTIGINVNKRYKNTLHSQGKIPGNPAIMKLC